MSGNFQAEWVEELERNRWKLLSGIIINRMMVQNALIVPFQE